ncbi:MAG: hypothetical protein UT24_C0022G0012 [Candidatus Woesebacteria bacterium GW2011_GWB1_39_12]|uniref:Uncharacterized protein n=1 Tax=Candidatus Woesebacteria bacterium GW2011_GWB1_39_12 TaxID=1618574 RepID=A0A0G0QDV8_9BACT|nr:MAG: hypothetical protein UT24_C0022G0012 [Candidatus Woesebacteria bacterium GW2011_GWB1_39_12]
MNPEHVFEHHRKSVEELEQWPKFASQEHLDIAPGNEVIVYVRMVDDIHVVFCKENDHLIKYCDPSGTFFVKQHGCVDDPWICCYSRTCYIPGEMYEYRIRLSRLLAYCPGNYKIYASALLGKVNNIFDDYIRKELKI